MRLLDLVHQSETRVCLPSPVGPIELPSPCDFRAAVAACPLRVVLADDLTSVCADLAYSEGDRLVRCLDLVRLPAERLWVEWDDHARADFTNDPSLRGRAGMLVMTEPGARRATVRTFFTDGGEDVRLAAMVTEVDLDADWPSAPPRDPFAGGDVPLSGADDPALVALLERLRFRFDPAWADYYRWQPDPNVRRQILSACLASVARDVPVLLALLLLMSTRAGVPQSRVDRAKVNAKRQRRGEPVLLDHVELCAPVFAEASAGGESARVRHGARLHHVRGHLVRRSDTVFWRSAHLRGDGRLGAVQSRTVTLTFGARERSHRAGSSPRAWG